MSYFDVSNFNVGPRQRRGRTQSAQDANAARIENLRAQLDSTGVKGFLADEAAESARLEQERLAAIKKVEDELALNLQALHRTERENVYNPSFTDALGKVNHFEDPRILYDPGAPTVLYDAGDLDRYNRGQVDIFMRENPSYYPDTEGKNVATIFKYLSAHGKNVIVSAVMLKNVFERLTYLGMLIPRPAQTVSAPVATRPAPVQKKQTLWDITDVYTGNSTADLFEGWSPDGSGQRVRLTNRQIDKLSENEMKTFSRVTVQPKPDYARIEDRDPDFLAAQFVHLGRS